MKEEIIHLKRIFQKHDALQEFEGTYFHHIGSTAIVGMFGKPIMDIMVVTKGLLPNMPDAIINDLKKREYEYCGPSPAAMDKN